MRQWKKTIPNPGLLRYYVIGNRERIIVLSPKAIADLLVNKSYDFIRPEIARVQLSKVTGEGLLVAEGDIHKVWLLRESCISCEGADDDIGTTQKLNALILLPTHQRIVSPLLDQGYSNDQRDRKGDQR